VNGIAASVWMPTRARVLIYRACGISVPVLVNVRPGITIRTQRLWIGPGTSINARCLFDNRADVVIGRNVGVGFDVHFITSTHDLTDPRVRAGHGAALPIRVGDGVWLGTRATILAGVTVGDGCVIAAGAVVIKDCMPHGIYGGVPARRIRDLSQ
jgi:maltose O-acetyltransferase